MNINYVVTETGFDNIDVKSQLEHQIQINETNKSGWISDKCNSMKIRFPKTGELFGSSYVKIPVRTDALLNIKNDDNYCFIRSI